MTRPTLHSFPHTDRLEAASADPPKGSGPYLRPKDTLLKIQETAWRPPTDLFETCEAYVAKVEVAGMRKEDIQVILDGEFLTLTGRREEAPSAVEKVRYRQMEVKYGTFVVQLRLPDDADYERVEAAYANGFLEVTIPKLQGTGTRQTKVTIRIG